MKIGIEVESIYNRKTVGEIIRGAYADGIPFSIRPEKIKSPEGAISPLFNRPKDNLPLTSTRWAAEADGSLYATIDDNIIDHKEWQPDIVELVSTVASGKVEFMKYLEELRKLMTWRDSSVELKDVMHFNQSCGCHIHFSFEDLNMNKICGYSPLINIRKTFFDGLKELDIRADLKALIKRQYFRRHANKVVKKYWKNDICGGQRNSEFNFNSYSRKGFEWRSFNLRGVRTWDEFFELLALGYDSANSFRKHVKRFSETENYNVGNKIKDKIKKYNVPSLYCGKMDEYRQPLNINIVVNGVGKARSTGQLGGMLKKYKKNNTLKLLEDYGRAEMLLSSTPREAMLDRIPVRGFVAEAGTPVLIEDDFLDEESD